MQPTPPGWPRISSALYYKDASSAITWLCEAFGFELRLKIEGDDNRIEHSELVFGDAVVMVSSEKLEKFPLHRAPENVGGVNTQNMMIYVDDVDAHFARAKKAGATIVTEPKNTDYGEEYWEDRGYECKDPGGHGWWIYQRIRSATSKG